MFFGESSIIFYISQNFGKSIPPLPEISHFLQNFFKLNNFRKTIQHTLKIFTKISHFLKILLKCFWNNHRYESKFFKNLTNFHKNCFNVSSVFPKFVTNFTCKFLIKKFLFFHKIFSQFLNFFQRILYNLSYTSKFWQKYSTITRNVSSFLQNFFKLNNFRET